jgi:hypothetical protein
MESASYMENNNDTSYLTKDQNTDLNSSSNNEEEHTPQLFSNENETQIDDDLVQTTDDHTEKLFDQDSNEEEDFEIPAFLRKQKF